MCARAHACVCVNYAPVSCYTHYAPSLQLAEAAAKAARQENAEDDLAMVRLESKKSKVRRGRHLQQRVPTERADTRCDRCSRPFKR